MTEQRPLKVFLCHAKADKPAARNLYRYLRSKGMDPWLDEEKLLPGQNWRLEIPNALFASDVIIICLSKSSVDKEGYVQKEIKFALDKAMEMPEGRIFIIPALLEECDVPESLKSYHWVELFEKNWGRKLMQSLNLRAASLHDVKQGQVSDDSSPRLPKPESAKIEEPVEKTLLQAESQGDDSVAIGGDVKGTTIITGDNNVIVQSPMGEYEAKPKEKKPDHKSDLVSRYGRASIFLSPDNVMEPTSAKKKAEGSPKPVHKVDFRKIGLIAVILMSLILGTLGINYAINNWPTTTLPTPTPPQQTKSATITRKPVTTTFTSIPPTATLTPKPATPIPALGIGSTKISEKDGMTMVFVPAGEFTMGSDNGEADEKPAHQVYLDSFWIDQTEVTNKMYALCVEAGVCQPPSSTSSYARKEYYGNSEFDDYPVIRVDWDKAKTYCEWAGRRLPTEAEWEKSARGLENKTYPWGDGIDCGYTNYYSHYSDPHQWQGYTWYMHYSQMCVGDTTKVGSYKSGMSPFSLYDMAGNVWEWVADWYKDDYFLDSPLENPLGPSNGQYRILRGGSWGNYEEGLRTSNRFWSDPTSNDSFIGFRCALSAE